MEKQFGNWVSLIGPCLHHNLGGYGEVQAHIQTVFAFFDVPEFWREPVRVMAQGAYYYGADDWMRRFAD
jgi:hypothetical protein